jgi:molybdenum-dependent DNA-binding transcriptional regulator ModE
MGGTPRQSKRPLFALDQRMYTEHDPEAGSMTRAAEELAVSYPVVSKTISELERTLGVKLFDRSISGVETTHYGRALLKSGVVVFDEMRKGLRKSKPSSSRMRANCGLARQSLRMPDCFQRSCNGFRKISRARWFTFCPRTSRFCNTTNCAIEKSSWCSGGFPQR